MMDNLLGNLANLILEHFWLENFCETAPGKNPPEDLKEVIKLSGEDD
jgi:hypothetical protein